MSQFKKYIIYTGFQIIFPVIAFAQIINPLGSNELPDLISKILGYVTRVGAVVAIIAFIWVGFKFVQAQGKPEDIKKAKTMFFYTVIGVAILLGAQLLATLVVGTIKSLGQ